MGNDDLTSVRERLENLKKNPKCVPKPLAIIPQRDGRPTSESMLTFERLFQQKVDKAITKIESIKEKMKSSETFTSYFYDLKKAEQEFLDLLKTAEEKRVEFPDNFNKKIEETKSKIRSKIK